MLGREDVESRSNQHNPGYRELELRPELWPFRLRLLSEQRSGALSLHTKAIVPCYLVEYIQR